MEPNKIEQVEKIVTSLVVQAMSDYWQEAVTIFSEDTDNPQDIAEDITREALASMGVSGTKERLYGKVDVKKAIYAFLPEPVPVALMLDAKAEKVNSGTATIQMSQTSMRVRLFRNKQPIDEAGKLDTVISRKGRDYRVVTVVAKYVYAEEDDHRELIDIIVSCIPSGDLQEKYNPSAEDTIWNVGRDAPSLGEDFRVRLNFAKLKERSAWRVNHINPDCTDGGIINVPDGKP